MQLHLDLRRYSSPFCSICQLHISVRIQFTQLLPKSLKPWCYLVRQTAAGRRAAPGRRGPETAISFAAFSTHHTEAATLIADYLTDVPKESFFAAKLASRRRGTRCTRICLDGP